MFCSQECVKISLETFHKFECPMLNKISSLDSSTMQMALRTFFVSLSYFDDSVGNLQEFLDENQISCTIFDGDVKNKKQNVLALNSLIFDEKIVVNETCFEEMFNASHDLMKLWSTHSSFIRKFLIKQIQIAEMNYHEIYTWPLKKGGLLDAEVENVKDTLAYKRQLVSSGTGSYLFCSLLNHNCAANVVRVFENEKMIVIVQRPISKGEQIFDNYGFSFTNVAKNDRQSQLMKQYKFRCSCKACEKNWPIMPKLEIFDKALLNKAKKYCRELGLEEVNHKKAYSNYKELCEILEKSKTEFPSLEKCSLMESAAAYLEITSKPQIQF